MAVETDRPPVIPANPVDTPKASRVRYFTRMNPLSFHGSKSDKDPQEFIDLVQKVIDIMGVTFIESAELAAYQLQDVAHDWYK